MLTYIGIENVIEEVCTVILEINAVIFFNANFVSHLRTNLHFLYL